MDENKQEEAGFLAGFAGASDSSSAPVEQTEAAKEPNVEQAEVKAEGQEEAAGDATAKADEPVIAGFTQEEIRNLLAKAAKVDELEAGLRKAHGKLGEINGNLQELRKAPAKTPEPPKVDIAHVEEDYPDIAAYIRAQLGQKEQPVEPVQSMPQAQQPVGADANADLQLALMDHLHEGWREKVVSRDFTLWLAAQPDDVRKRYESAETAKELSGVIGQFDAWSTGRATRNTKGQQRLEQAITPSGAPGKPKMAPSEQDAFVAGFKSVMAR